jgi:hypothetical protein
MAGCRPKVCTHLLVGWSHRQKLRVFSIVAERTTPRPRQNRGSSKCLYLSRFSRCVNLVGCRRCTSGGDCARPLPHQRSGIVGLHWRAASETREQMDFTCACISAASGAAILVDRSGNPEHPFAPRRRHCSERHACLQIRPRRQVFAKDPHEPVASRAYGRSRERKCGRLRSSSRSSPHRRRCAHGLLRPGFRRCRIRP